jgi:hypothetical protein
MAVYVGTPLVEIINNLNFAMLIVNGIYGTIGHPRMF